MYLLKAGKEVQGCVDKNIQHVVCLSFSLESEKKKKEEKKKDDKPLHLLAIANQYSARPAWLLIEYICWGNMRFPDGVADDSGF